MDKRYAQIVDGVVNLVGGPEVGLLQEVEMGGVIIREIANSSPISEGWGFVHGEFVPPDEIDHSRSASPEELIAELTAENEDLKARLSITEEAVLELAAIIGGA